MACFICWDSSFHNTLGSIHRNYVASPPWKSMAQCHCIWASLTSVEWTWSHCSHIPNFRMARERVCFWAWLKFSRKMDMIYLNTDVPLAKKNAINLEVTLVDSRVLRAGRSFLGFWVLGVAHLRGPSPKVLPSLWPVHVTMEVWLEMESPPQLVYFSSSLGEREFL